MTNVTPHALAKSITKESILRYINSVEPFLGDIKAAYAKESEFESRLSAAEAMIKHNMV